jgi:3-oxoacyl-[acyl-carrier protein] reductase
LDISLLINSAGLYDVGFFETISEEKHLNEINVNLFGTISMTRKVIPMLLDHRNKTTKKSGIINISSIAGLVVCPTSAVYSATKTAVYMFTQCLQAEYSGTIRNLYR